MTRGLSHEADGGSHGHEAPDQDAAGRPPAGPAPATDTDAAAGRASRGWGPQGKATTTILLRHGQTALSVERRFAGRGDFPLTDVGR